MPFSGAGSGPVQKLDKVGPADKRPSTDGLQHFDQKKALGMKDC